MENKGIIGKVVEGFAESARTVHAINKENLAAVKADSKANFEAVTASDPGFEKFKQAKGFMNKVKVIGENITEGAKAASEKEKELRAEIQSHEAYRTILEDGRGRRQATIAGSW
jgi:hypothetical protein